MFGVGFVTLRIEEIKAFMIDNEPLGSAISVHEELQVVTLCDDMITVDVVSRGQESTEIVGRHCRGH